MKTKSIVLLFVTLLLLSNGYWLYVTIDNSVTLTHMGSQMERQAASLDAMRVSANLLIPKMKKETLVPLLETRFGSGFWKAEEDGEIYVLQGGEVAFRFVDGYFNEIVGE